LWQSLILRYIGVLVKVSFITVFLTHFRPLTCLKDKPLVVSLTMTCLKIDQAG